MDRRQSVAVGLAIAVALVGRLAMPAAQAPSPATTRDAAAKKGTPPRTPDGKPDLRGRWSYATITPLERPADLADKAFLTPEEAAAYEKKVIAANNKDQRPEDRNADVSNAYNDFWWDRGTNLVGTLRTSLIVDPPNGRMPELTPEGKQRAAARVEARRRRGPADGPEDRNLSERCLLSLNAGPPMIPSAYNNNIQIFQTPTALGITNEMIHNYRVIPLDGRPRLGGAFHMWMGDSRGRWEGDTLVVETMNYRGDSAFRGASDALKVTERFSRTAADVLMYEFTIEDPKTWTRSWSGQLPMTPLDEPLYEYACHEGNHAMQHMLSGARADERKGVK
jgi:hypothetical protein